MKELTDEQIQGALRAPGTLTNAQAWDMVAVVRAILKEAGEPTVPPGFVLVPLEPTPKMLIAWQQASIKNLRRVICGDDAVNPADGYKAMLAARPSAAPQAAAAIAALRALKEREQSCLNCKHRNTEASMAEGSPHTRCGSDASFSNWEVAS